jgi:hypothetical protein
MLIERAAYYLVRESRMPLVVSSLVSFAYVRPRSLVFGLMRRCRSRTSTVFGELLSRVLKIGRSASPSQFGLTSGIQRSRRSVVAQRACL